MILFVNSFAHFLVDALCAAVLFSLDAAAGSLTLAIVLYNSLAFSTQCLAGLLADARKHYLLCESIGALMVTLGVIVPLPPLIRIVLAGLGNSLFHVGGGAMTLTQSKERAWRLGVFVAPGALGIAVGGALAERDWVLCLLLLACIAAACYFWPRTPMTLELREEDICPPKLPLMLVIALLAAVAVRAMGGSAVQGVKSTAFFGLMPALTVFAGKALGGFACDRFGPKTTALLSVPAAAVLLTCCGGIPALILLGQLLLNLSMPITLWLLWRAMPDAPGFAFGLAASALWPGTIIGVLVQPVGVWRSVWMIGCFLFACLAVVCADRRLKIVTRS